MQIPFFRRIADCRRILIAGAGGGYDFVTGIPLYTYFKERGHEVWLANLSFTNLDFACNERISPHAWIVDQVCGDLEYFPERQVCDWFGHRGQEVSIYAFEKTGVTPLVDAYRAIVERHKIDAIVLVDGGTDSLLKGDEARLGTIVEDATSLVAVSEVAGPQKFLACLGFGIDHFHGVSHYSFLENTAETIKAGGYLGGISISKEMEEGKIFLDLVDYLNKKQPRRQSIVCNSIAAAIRGEFGDYHGTGRTVASELFINPLMAFYWTYDLSIFATKMGFYQRIVNTQTSEEVREAILRHHSFALKRPWKGLPI